MIDPLEEALARSDQMVPAVIISQATPNGAGPERPPVSSWAPVELGALVAGVQSGAIVGPVPTLMRRSDGPCLLYPGEIHSLAGEPESCKGWIALSVITQVLAAGGTALYLDFEDAPASIITRLLALGAEAEHIVDRLTYVRPTDPLDRHQFAALLEAQHNLAVIDGLGEAYALLGLEISSNDDAAKFLAAIPRPLADRGAAVLEVDHVGRDKDHRGRYAIGAQHKLAGVACAYGTEVIEPPSRTGSGLVKLLIFKDRHGHVRPHARGKLIAQVQLDPVDDGERITVTLAPPIDEGDEGFSFRPTGLMEATSRVIERQAGISNSDLRDAVRGKGAWKATALRLLILEDYVRPEKDGRSTLHYSLRPYREGDECLP